MRYAGPNQGFGWHYDGLDCSAAAATGGQRIATLLVYLDANYNGGRTVFGISSVAAVVEMVRMMEW